MLARSHNAKWKKYSVDRKDSEWREPTLPMDKLQLQFEAQASLAHISLPWLFVYSEVSYQKSDGVEKGRFLISKVNNGGENTKTWDDSGAFEMWNAIVPATGCTHNGMLFQVYHCIYISPATQPGQNE